MTRTIAEIKAAMTAEFMKSETAARAWGFTPGDEFTDHFSKVSVESVLFYIFAAAAWVIECLFDEHRRDVTDQIERMIAHRPKWYRDKTLGFLKGVPLISDTDQFDIRGMTESDIAAARVVKHAVAVEDPGSSILTIKVAGGDDHIRKPLDGDTQAQLAAYISEFKDAGVRIALVSALPDVFDCAVDVYYDPMVTADVVREQCAAAIKGYIENLPFNGEYTNMALVDALQRVPGARVVEFKWAKSAPDGATPTAIDARRTPRAGYFTPNSITINMKAYENGEI